ncbi:MAG: hypothetical protein OHK0029_37380 [Armatimonadaceae bacterium]
MPNGYLLDANIFRLYVQGDPLTIAQMAVHAQEVFLSSVTIEEMVVGRLNLISRARSGKGGISIVDAHAGLIGLLDDIRPIPTLIYSDAAQTVFKSFPQAVLRIGPQDCRIAAQAIAHDMTVVTRNLRDFLAIGASCEDWSSIM